MGGLARHCRAVVITAGGVTEGHLPSARHVCTRVFAGHHPVKYGEPSRTGRQSARSYVQNQSYCRQTVSNVSCLYYLGVRWNVLYTLICTHNCECTISLLTILVILLWLQLMLDCRVAMWNQPSKTYGFWNTDRANAKYHTNLDPAIQRLSGRHHPYED